tara:strand:+ start:271 stop:465 length:195 start_codon:yes stop_codon:yes gene_type:complete
MNINTQETMLVRADGIYILTEEDVTMLKLVFNTLEATDKPTGNLLLEVLTNSYCGRTGFSDRRI